jgi:hypothetical protein
MAIFPHKSPLLASKPHQLSFRVPHVQPRGRTRPQIAPFWHSDQGSSSQLSGLIQLFLLLQLLPLIIIRLSIDDGDTQ